MKKVTQTKRSTLVKSGGEAHAYTAWIADLRSRNSLLNWLSTDLYEREGKAQTNFDLTMPSDDCDLARQLVKDPQKFEVFGLSEAYSEKELKAAIVANIESTLPKTFQKLSWSLSSVNHHRKPVDFCYTILTSYVTNHHACRRKPDCHLSAERDRPGACARRTPLLGGGKRN